MKKAILILLIIMLVFCLFACGTESVKGTIIEKVYIPSERHTGFNWVGRNSGFYSYRTKAEYYIIVDTGEEQVKVQVKKKVYEQYNVGDVYTIKR